MWFDNRLNSSKGSAASPGACLNQLTVGSGESLQAVVKQEEMGWEEAEIGLPGLATAD